MEKYPSWLERRLFNLPIAWKLGIIMGVLSFALIGSLALTFGAMDVLGSMRAYIEGEGRWSKAQKQASYHLERYAMRRDEADYAEFLHYLSIPEADRRAREALDAPATNLAAVRDAFLAGGNHPRDLPGLIRLYRYFRHVRVMEDAMHLWTLGDRDIADLRAIGESIHGLILRRTVDTARIRVLLERADEINHQMTPREDAFSRILGHATRVLRRTVLSLLLLASLALWGLAFWVAFVIARHLTTQLRSLRDAATRLAHGDYSEAVPLPSKDEIGDLSHAFHAMMVQREQAEDEILKLNQELEKRVQELREANKELDSFCYSVSHDLRAPLRSIDGFSAILEEEQGPALPPVAQELVKSVRRNAGHMSELIDGLLSFSRLSQRPLQKSRMDLTALVHEVVTELREAEKGRLIEVIVQDLGAAEGDPILIRQVFINLISNALKFTRGRSPARIEAGRQVQDGVDIYFVRDNGIGFDMHYASKLFGVFQRLHSEKDFEGTGVGLALVHRIITRHGGRIWAESNPDKGACFYFTLAQK